MPAERDVAPNPAQSRSQMAMRPKPCRASWLAVHSPRFPAPTMTRSYVVDMVASRGRHAIPHEIVETADVLLDRRVDAAVAVGARGHTQLHLLADLPVFPVDQVEDLN